MPPQPRTLFSGPFPSFHGPTVAPGPHFEKRRSKAMAMMKTTVVKSSVTFALRQGMTTLGMTDDASPHRAFLFFVF